MHEPPTSLSAPSSEEASFRPGHRRLLFWCLAIAMLGYGSFRRSLWADEFHSWHHANSEGLRELLWSVRSDNHPPLSFLLEQLSSGLFGSTELALRLPSLLVGLLFLALLRRYLDLLVPFPGARIAPWLVIASSYYFVIFSEARMYSLLALATLGLMLGLASALSEGKAQYSRWWITLWTCIGLHAHYYFIHELVISGIFLGLVWLWHLDARKRLPQLLLPFGLGLLLFLPWGAYGFWHQIHGDLPPGRAAGNLSLLRDGFAHMFHWNASLGGIWAVRLIAIPGTLLACIACLLGTLRLLPKVRAEGAQGIISLMLLVYGIGLPCLAWLISRVSERSTFGWRYLAGAGFCVLIIATLGLAGRSRWHRVLRVALFTTMGSITLINLGSGGQEDHRKLVEFILAHGLPTDAVLDKPPYDPIPKPLESSWRYYIERLDQASNRALPTEFGYNSIAMAQQKPRVWVWFRDSYHPWVSRSLRKSHGVEQVWQMGPLLRLHLFSKSSERAKD